MIKGIDYSFSKPPISALTEICIGLAMRYISTPGNLKNITRAEADELEAAGIALVIVYETTADFMLGGFSAGVDAAHSAQAQLDALGRGAMRVYFAADFDASPGQASAIMNFLDGAATVLSAVRVGVYGKFAVVKTAIDHGYAAWQTYAWSIGEWDMRAVIRQVLNDQILAGASVDYDEASTVDLGQHPVFRTLQEGSAGPRVKLLQRLLGGLSVDGMFGPLTRAAVERFQSEHLEEVRWADGVVGPLTAPAIGVA